MERYKDFLSIDRLDWCSNFTKGACEAEGTHVSRAERELEPTSTMPFHMGEHF